MGCRVECVVRGGLRCRVCCDRELDCVGWMGKRIGA